MAIKDQRIGNADRGVGGASSIGFAGDLTALKRQARLRGRPVTSSEISGVTAGHAAGASERLFRGETIDIEKGKLGLAGEQVDIQKGQLALSREAQEIQQSQFAEEIVFRNKQLRAEAYSARKARKSSGFCIIISTCTSANSYEVELSRKYRNEHMDGITLAGYYALCEKVVPVLKRQVILRKIVRKLLVDNLTDYFEKLFGMKKTREKFISHLVTGTFLGYCKVLGEDLTENRKKVLLAKHRG